MLFKTPLRRSEILIILSWFLLNLLQSAFTALSADEAYYHMYAQFPAWGYFDHPPMVAMFIRAGEMILPGTLGLRFVSVVSQIITLLIIRALVVRENNEKHLPVFWLIAASIPVMQVYGFITTPDVPLLFFGALFFLVYRNFLERTNLLNALLLGLVSACMLYSKYHGVLIIFFTLCSNLKLLRAPLFWLAGVFAAVLMLPHLFWHIHYDFPVIYYHFYWRASEFKIDHVTGYLFSQALVFSPFVFPFIIAGLWKQKKEKSDFLRRALRFNFAGFLLFFFIFSFRERIEAHWTLAVCIPLLFFGFEIYSQASERRQRLISLFAAISVVLVTGARSILFFDLLPVKNDFHKQVASMKKIEDEAKGDDIIFSCSYQHASMYSFYSGRHAHSLNATVYRKNQYDIWSIESEFYLKPVTIIARYPTNIPGEKRIGLPNGDTVFIGRKLNYVPLQKVDFTLPRITEQWNSSSEQKLTVSIENHYPFPVNLADSLNPAQVSAYLCKFGKVENEFRIQLLTEKPILQPGEKRNVQVVLSLPSAKGTWNMGFSLHRKGEPLTFNSNLTLVTLK